MTQNEKALNTIRLFYDNSIKKSRLVLKEAVKSLANDLVETTPTYFDDLPTSGSTKANWQFSVNGPDSSYDENRTDISGQATISRLRSEIQGTPIKNDSVLYLSNSAPSIRYLEYGWYPTNTRGSIHPVTGKREIRSEGGFSTHALYGIIGITSLKWEEYVSDAMAKYAGPAT